MMVALPKTSKVSIVRERKSIMEEYGADNPRDQALIETLLDIRQLLAILVVHTESGATAAAIRDVAKNKP
jgi:hypothetical protein